MQKKAQLVHWTDESVSQETTRGSRDFNDICDFRYIMRSDISDSVSCATANRRSKHRAKAILDLETTRFFRIRFDSRLWLLTGPLVYAYVWAPGKRGELRVALSSATREWTISPPHTGAWRALCGQGTLRP